MIASARQNPPQPADQGVSRPVALENINPDSRRGDFILSPVAGAPFDDVEIVAFDNVAHPYIRATIAVRCGPIVIHGVHLLHDGPGRLFVRLPQVSATLPNGRFSQASGPAMTFPTPELAAAWRAAVMERLLQQYPRPMRRASEPREGF